MNKNIIAKHQIASIITSFNPNIERLRNLCQILSDFSFVFVVDNSNSLMETPFNDLKDVMIIGTGKNLGTLAAYNYGIEHYPNFEYYWLWDQDTIILSETASSFLTKSFELFLRESQVATTFYDVKTKIDPFNKNFALYKTSTTLFHKKRVEQLTDFWFDSKMFMDYGDWDLAQTLQYKGGVISQIEVKNYTHAYGDPENTLLGTKFRSSEMRLYMQGLNTVYLIKNRKKTSLIVRLLVARFFFLPLKNLLFKNSFNRTLQFYKGILDGLKGITSSDFMDKKQ